MPKHPDRIPEAFMVRLQREALKQSYLEKYRWLPHQADQVTSLIGRYTWQTLVIVATIASIVLQWLKL